MTTEIRERIHQILLLNDNLAFSFWELFDKLTDKIWVVRYLKLAWALSILERKGLVEAKHIGGKKYYLSILARGKDGKGKI